MPTKKKLNRLNLEDALSRNVFHNAVITTYTFDPLFFEDYCLEQFRSFTGNNNISVIVDRQTYEGIISLPDAQQPKLANIRYLVHPVTLTGRFHPKLFLLTTKTSGRLIFGSANLTRPGLTSNAELVDQYDFEEQENEQYRYLFCEAFAFLSTVAERWPSRNLSSNLQELYRETPWLHTPPPTGPAPILFLHNLDRSLWTQLREAVADPVECVHVVSRFFDDQPALIDRIFLQYSPSKLFIYTENGRTTLTQSWLKHPLVKSGRAEVLFCAYEDEGYRQALHAKAIVFVSPKGSRVVYGSANFSARGLLCEAKNGNVETLIVLPLLTGRQFNLKQFVDPCNNAHRLAADDALKTSARDSIDVRGSKPIYLNEAVLERDRLTLHGIFPADVPTTNTAAHLVISGTTGRGFKIVQESESTCSARVDEQLIPLLAQRSSRVWLRDRITGQDVSNTLLVTNLVDIETHENLREQRHIREAKESASQFFAVLNDLLRAGDSNALLTFLSLCDIPLLNVPGRAVFRRRPVWEGGEGMRSLGERNLQICKSLHEATLRFFDRHLRKLQRHAETRLLDGVPNFLHIFLSMGNVLRTQIERTVLGLEAKSSRITVNEWYDLRLFWNIYFDRFKTLMHCLWDDYLTRITAEYQQKDLEREFGPDLEAINELCNEMIRFRERVNQIRVTKRFSYGYFDCVLGPERWPRFSNMVTKRQQQVEFAVLGAAAHQYSQGVPP